MDSSNESSGPSAEDVFFTSYLAMVEENPGKFGEIKYSMLSVDGLNLPQMIYPD
jgi:hypothetical protein